MLSLLFGIAFWCVIFVAAIGAVVWLGFIALLIEEHLNKFAAHERQPRRVPPRAATPRIRPFDQDDPLERQLALPDAPDPKWLVR